MSQPVHLLADLLAGVLEEWCRFYGTTTEQRAAVQAIVDYAFASGRP